MSQLALSASFKYLSTAVLILFFIHFTSPTLANLFQNNLHDIFDSECDQIFLDGQSFSSLSFADDLVLILTSANDLQVCLNKLENYCKRWRLSVNVKKNKDNDYVETKLYSKGKLSYA